jgi:predicted phage gp36 major capsid-like protein
VSETEASSWRRAAERLMDGQREALEIARAALEREGADPEDALADVVDVLEGSLEDVRAELGLDEEG